MIYLYSGTPGSGKSLHCARLIYYTLLRNYPVICNFEINRDAVKHSDNFHYIPNGKLDVEYLKEFSAEYFSNKSMKEDSILLFIDECQMLFNARDWSANGRRDWCEFFQVHRHYGYKIILIAQFDRMLDRQIRSLIEYEVVHRKISNFGMKGRFLSLLMASKNMFCFVTMWYPLKMKVSSEFMRPRKKFFNLYNTYLHFDREEDVDDS